MSFESSEGMARKRNEDSQVGCTEDKHGCICSDEMLLRCVVELAAAS